MEPCDLKQMYYVPKPRILTEAAPQHNWSLRPLACRIAESGLPRTPRVQLDPMADRGESEEIRHLPLESPMPVGQSVWLW